MTKKKIEQLRSLVAKSRDGRSRHISIDSATLGELLDAAEGKAASDPPAEPSDSAAPAATKPTSRRKKSAE